MNKMPYIPTESEKIADEILETIDDKQWEKLTADEQAMRNMINTLAENMDFSSIAEVAKDMISVLADYISEEFLIDNLNHGVELLLNQCIVEEKQTKEELIKKVLLKED